MAISVLKKNKNLINKIIKELEKELKKSNDFISHRFDAELVPVLYGMHLQFYAKFDIKIKAVESKGKVYIGFDLSKTSVGYAYDSDNLGDVIAGHCFPYYSLSYINNEDLKEALKKEIKDFDKYDRISIVPLIEETVVYREIYEAAADIVASGRVEATLGAKSWPKLDDRKILPLIVLDFDKCEADYTSHRHPSSYRANREKVDIFKVSYCAYEICRYAENLFGLVDRKLMHSDIKNSALI